MLEVEVSNGFVDIEGNENDPEKKHRGFTKNLKKKR